MNKISEYERQMSEDIGGEAGAEVKRLVSLKKVHCHGICFKDTQTDDIRGYPHDGGLADATGMKWWIYVHCSNPVKRAGKRDVCGYDTSWGKVRK